MTDIKTIDDRVRAKAREEFHRRVDGLFSQIDQLFHANIYIDDGEFKSKGIMQMLATVSIAIKRTQSPEHEDEAVKAFLAQVDNLQSQIDELKEEVQSD